MAREPLAAEVDRARRLAEEMAAHGSLSIELSPMEALSVIGQLQLATRHPNNDGSTVDLAEAVIDRIVAAYAAGGPSTHLERLVLEGARPSYDAAAPRRAIADAELVPPHIRERMAALADRPLVLERLFPLEVDESLPADVIEVRGETTTRIRGWSPPAPTQADVVRPAGLVWSGIRVDEMPRLYEVLDRSHEACPARLEDGEIVGDPATGRVWVWSLAEFGRLVEFSRALHEIARGRRLPGVTYGELTRRARELGEAGADALDIVRALPPVVTD